MGLSADRVVEVTAVSPADYVRAIEAHVCQKNDGHIIRIVGPAFEVVCGWERQGIPLKVALRGIDRYFERYYRNGPKRRPVRVEFCDTDVLETFDEWRRAVGVAARAVRETPESGYGPSRAPGGVPESQLEPASRTSQGPSLPAHLERVLIRLSSARATGKLGAETDALIDRVAAELDRARASAGGVRGEARKALTTRAASPEPTTKHKLFSEDACEIISTFARSFATAANALATMPGMPCIPLPLIETRLTLRMEVTALTPRDDGCPCTETRVPGSSG